MTDKQKNGQEHLRLQCELELGKNKAVMKQRVRVWRCPELICGVDKINIFLQVGFSLDVPEAGPVSIILEL